MKSKSLTFKLGIEEVDRLLLAIKLIVEFMVTLEGSTTVDNLFQKLRVIQHYAPSRFIMTRIINQIVQQIANYKYSEINSTNLKLLFLTDENFQRISSDAKMKALFDASDELSYKEVAKILHNNQDMIDEFEFATRQYLFDKKIRVDVGEIQKVIESLTAIALEDSNGNPDAISVLKQVQSLLRNSNDDEVQVFGSIVGETGNAYIEEPTEETGLNYSQS